MIEHESDRDLLSPHVVNTTLSRQLMMEKVYYVLKLLRWLGKTNEVMIFFFVSLFL